MFLSIFDVRFPKYFLTPRLLTRARDYISMDGLIAVL